jgi:hypothetical protein
MIQSVWRIELINAAGTTRLLDFGDDISEEIKPKISQDAARYAPIGAAWGETEEQPGALVTLGWDRRENHASHAAARGHVMRAAAATATRKTGTLRISIQDGEVWDIEDCTVLATEPVTVTKGPIRTLTTYQAIGGRMIPAEAIALYSGIPWEYILQNWEAVTADWEDL